MADDSERFSKSRDRFKKPGFETWTRRADHGKIVNAMRVLSKKGL